MESLKNINKLLDNIQGQSDQDIKKLIDQANSSTLKQIDEEEETKVVKVKGVASTNIGYFSPQVNLAQRQHIDLLGFKQRQIKSTILGICGGSSSGKSTVASMIKSRLRNQPQIINLIDFYLPVRGNMRRRTDSSSITSAAIDEQDPEVVAKIKKEINEIDRTYDFDVPSAIDWDLLIKGLKLLKEGKPFDKPIYNEHLKLREKRTEKVFASELIILEGHLIFTNQELMDLLDMKVFIDTDDDVRLSRRVLKMSKKGTLTNLQDLLYKYEKQIKPAYEKYIEPSKKYADIIIPNYGFSMDSIDVNELMIPIPAVDLIIKQVESSHSTKVKQFI